MSRLSEKYIAGFLDADGSVALSFKPDCNIPQLQLSFSQKTSQDEVLHRIQMEIGGGISIVTTNGEQYSRLALYGAKAIAVLNRIRQHLVIKRHYTDWALEQVGKPVESVASFKMEMKVQRRIRSLPLPNFPPRRWLAGYFDGDGCLSVQEVRDNGRATLIAHMAASEYDTEGLEIIHKAFGGGIYNMCDGRVRQWKLNLVPSKAIQFLEYFAKHLIVKRDQAEVILSCARIGHYHNGIEIKERLKQLKAQPHRLSETDVAMAA
jgi:LAGLIDADG endonuclease